MASRSAPRRADASPIRASRNTSRHCAPRRWSTTRASRRSSVRCSRSCFASSSAAAIASPSPRSAAPSRSRSSGTPSSRRCPRILRADAFRPFIELLRANMARAGALRIDHAFALMRLFWVPRGARPDAGAYVAYPFDALLAVLKLESQRNRCLVVGEDLGTVPPGFREACAAAGVLSYRLLYFERGHDGTFTRPGDYPALALALAST